MLTVPVFDSYPMDNIHASSKLVTQIMGEKNWASATALKGVISAVRKERGRFDADVQRLRLKSRDYFGTSPDYSHPVGFTLEQNCHSDENCHSELHFEKTIITMGND